MVCAQRPTSTPYQYNVMKLTPEDYLKMRDRCKELERDSIRQREHILDLERINAQLSDTINRMDGGCARAIELRQLLDELFNIGRSEVVSDDEIRRRMANLQDEITKLRKENIQLYNQRIQLNDEKKQQADSILELQTELERLRVAATESAEKIEVLNDSINQLRNECSKKEEDIRFCKAKADYFWNCRSALEDKYQKLKEGYESPSNCMNTFAAALKDADTKIQSANDQRAANAKKEAKEAKERAESASERVRYLERKLRDVEILNDSLMKELARRQECQTEIREHDADLYQLDVLKYAPDHHDYLLNVIYAAMGMCGEAGEASELVKKYAYHAHKLDSDHLARELGDVLWYVSYMAHLLGYPLGRIMVMNQEKLAKRYPDGKFDEERSRNREEGDI